MLLNSLKFKQTWWRKLFFWPTSNASVNTHTYSTTNASVMYLHKSWTHNHKWSPKFYFELLFFKIKILLVFTDLRNIYNSFSNFAHVGEVGSWTEYYQPASWLPYHMVPQPLHHLFWECQIVVGVASKSSTPNIMESWDMIPMEFRFQVRFILSRAKKCRQKECVCTDSSVKLQKNPPAICYS